jgi:hypothetical protein
MRYPNDQVQQDLIAFIRGMSDEDYEKLKADFSPSNVSSSVSQVKDSNSFSCSRVELTAAVKAFINSALSAESLYGVINLVSQKYNSSRWDLFSEVQASLSKCGLPALSESIFSAGTLSSSTARNFMQNISSGKVGYQWEKLPDNALDNHLV